MSCESGARTATSCIKISTIILLLKLCHSTNMELLVIQQDANAGEKGFCFSRFLLKVGSESHPYMKICKIPHLSSVNRKDSNQEIRAAASSRLKQNNHSTDWLIFKAAINTTQIFKRDINEDLMTCFLVKSGKFSAAIQSRIKKPKNAYNVHIL